MRQGGSSFQPFSGACFFANACFLAGAGLTAANPAPSPRAVAAGPRACGDVGVILCQRVIASNFWLQSQSPNCLQALQIWTVLQKFNV
jgi:hypothetical protein